MRMDRVIRSGQLGRRKFCRKRRLILFVYRTVKSAEILFDLVVGRIQLSFENVAISVVSHLCRCGSSSSCGELSLR